MKTRKLKNQKRKLSPKQQDVAVPFIEHLYELRRRLFFCLISVSIISTAAYFVQQKLVDALLRPTHGQQFIYTSVGGGISFLFKFCIYLGVALSLPVIAYQILRYLEPILKFDSKKRIIVVSAICGVLAIAGMTFGYFVGLPSALHFLLHQFTTKQIHPLLTVSEYLQFVTIYMLGSALMFQIPLILLFINRIKPLKPKQLWHYERWVVLIAFVASGLMNPTPELMSQLELAGPIIVMYQIGIFIVWRVNSRHSYPKHIQELLMKDSEQRASREQTASQLLPAPLTPLQLAASSVADTAALPESEIDEVPVVVTRPQIELPRRSYVMDVRPPMRRALD